MSELAVSEPKRRTRGPAKAPVWPPLEKEKRPVVGTAQAAFYLGRSEGCLRDWQWSGKGPLRAIKVGDRLAWKTAELRALVGLDVAEKS